MISIIIVNYNAGPLLSRCLQSIAEQTYRDYEVIIVDNASADRSLDGLEPGPQLRIMRNARNAGFAAAQNQGMRAARGANLMPLNFDIEMTPQFLEQMMSAMATWPMAGAVTGKLMQMSPEGERLDKFYSTGHVMQPNAYALHRGAGERDCGQYDEPCAVFGAPGAAPLYRRAMLDDIAYRGQFFDESLFMWYEDVDLDWRAGKLGWLCVYAPKAVAYHRGHPEGHNGNSWQITLSIRNRWLVVLANDDLRPKDLYALLLYELSLLRYVLGNGYFSAYRAAWAQFVGLMPLALRKRRWLKQRARSRPTYE